MKLTFIGAAHEVTGSCTLLDCCGGNFLIDYGMEQGVNVFENVPLPVLPGQIDAVFLTHAHIDHSGMLAQAVQGWVPGKSLRNTGNGESLPDHADAYNVLNSLFKIFSFSTSCFTADSYRFRMTK